MFTHLAIVLSLALYCAASPTVVNSNRITLPITRHFNFTGASTILKIDQARAQAIKARTRVPPGQFRSAAAAAIHNVPVTNQITTYTAEVTVGESNLPFTLLVDTGSSNTWVGANPQNPFVTSGSTTLTGELVEVTYGSGAFLGEEVLDTLSFGGISIPQQSLGAALISEGFAGVDGIIGIGPTDLTDGTTTGGGTIPTVTDNAFSAGIISAKQVGVSFEPTTSPSTTNGELTFGGADPAKFIGDLITIPITSSSPANTFFGIDQAVSYGDTVILDTTAGIVDTGTTLILLASDALAAYQSATGAVPDETTGLLRITPTQFANLQNLTFSTAEGDFVVTPNAQIWPRALNTAIDGQTDAIYLIVGDLGSISGEGLDFIDGFAFLERYYALFDSSDSPSVSFAETPFTFATTN